jgi:hypothetical protein
MFFSEDFHAYMTLTLGSWAAFGVGTNYLPHEGTDAAAIRGANVFDAIRGSERAICNGFPIGVTVLFHDAKQQALMRNVVHSEKLSSCCAMRGTLSNNVR